MARVEYRPPPGRRPDSRPTPYASIPAPHGASRLGGCLRDWLGPGRAEQILKTLSDYAEQCGPLARIELGPVRLLLVSDPVLVREVLGRSSANRKGVLYQLTRPVFDSVLLQNGSPWLRHRRCFAQAFAHIDPERSLKHGLVELSQQWAKLRTPIQLDQHVVALCSRICGRMLYGETLPAELDDARRLVQHELAGVGLDLQCRPWSLANPMRWRRSHRARIRLLHFHAEVVRRRKQRPITGTGEDALDALLAMAERGVLPNHEEGLAHMLLNMFFAAHEVLASSCFWCLYTLARTPRLQQRLRRSIEAGHGELLDAVLKESLRLYPGYPLFTRTPAHAIELGGYRIPARTQIFVVPWVIHRLEEYWPNPECFDPDRWQAQAPTSPAYFPFGAGYRGCIGQAIARPVMAGLVRHVVQHHRLRTTDGPEVKPKYWGTVLPSSAAFVEVND